MLSSKRGYVLNLLITEHTKLTQNVTTYENSVFLGTAVHGFVLKKSKVIDFLFKKRGFLMHGSLLQTISRKY